MKERSKLDSDADKKTLRTILAENYHHMIKQHGVVATRRFPHLTYGQDPKSETFKKSYPTSFKTYFFKLVKNIIISKKGKMTIPKVACNLVLNAGAREVSNTESVFVKSLNTKLNKFVFGAGQLKYKN
jgi:hypothetical protein